MSTFLEEILIKVGIDQSQLNRELPLFSRRVEEAGQGAHKSFLHASNGAKQFHELIHKISEQAPGLGLGIQAFISPMTAIIGALVAGFVEAKDKLKEYNKELEETGKLNAQPIFGEDKVRQLKRDLEEIEDRFKKFQKSQQLEPTAATVAAIAEEKDPKVRLNQARQALAKFTSERDAADQALRASVEKQKRLTSLTEKAPGAITEAERQLEEARKSEGKTFWKNIPAGPGRFVQVVDDAAMARAEKQIVESAVGVARLKKQQEDNSRALKITNDQYAEGEKQIQRYNQAIKDLQQTLDNLGWNPKNPLWPTKKQGSMSLVPQGAGMGFVGGEWTVFDKMTAHLQTPLEKLANTTEGRFLRVLVPNGE